MNDDPNKIRITSNDLESVQVDPPWAGASPPQNVAGNSGPRQWGRISGPATGPVGASATDASGGSFLLKSWVYLGIAGLVAAFIAWALCEPGFEDGEPPRWGNHLIFPLLVTAVSVAFAAAESLVERSVQKAITRGLLAGLPSN